MGQITVTVNGFAYQVGCDDGEEAHVATLAEYVDKRVAELAGSVGQVGEARLLLLAALLIADDLSELYDRIEASQGSGQGSGQELGQESGKGPDPAALAGLAERLEEVADKLESA